MVITFKRSSGISNGEFSIKENRFKYVIKIQKNHFASRASRRSTGE